MLLKKFIATITFLHLIFYSFSAIQFYEGLLNKGVVTAVLQTSYISWGTVDIDFIQLDRITGNNDGMIKFNIQPTDYVEVSLTEANNLDARYGFIFKSYNHFTIQLDGVEKNLGLLGYNETDVFRVIKCGLFIRFYKNLDLLYEHCYNNSAEDLVHTTHVTTAVNTELSLVFDSELSECSAPITLPSFEGQVVPLANVSSDNSRGTNDSSTSDRSNTSVSNEERRFAKNKIIVASVYNQDGIPIKQFRIRTTKSGTLPESHSIYAYIEENYRVEFKEDKK